MSIRNYQKKKRDQRRIRRIARSTGVAVVGTTEQSHALAGFLFASIA